jgi:hypothetical protein
MPWRSIFLRGLPRPASSEDKATVCIVMVLLLCLDLKCAKPRQCGSSPPSSSIKRRVRMHPLALAESGWVWVRAGSRPAGLRTGRAIPGLRRDAALPVRQNTRQGREGGALPKPFSKDHSIMGYRMLAVMLLSRFKQAAQARIKFVSPHCVPVMC